MDSSTSSVVFISKETNDTNNNCAAWTSTKEPKISAIFVVLLLISFATVMTNALILLAFYAEKRLRSYPNQYIISITISDLLVGLLMCVRSTIHLYSGWAFGDIAGSTFLGVQNTILSVSVLGMVVVCMDRFIATIYPVKHYQLKSKAKANVLNSFTWMFSIVFWLPITTLWNIVSPATELTSQGFPRPNYTQYASTTIVVAFFRLIGPFFLISILYIMIYHRVKKTGNECIQRKFGKRTSHAVTGQENRDHLPESKGSSSHVSSTNTQGGKEEVAPVLNIDIGNNSVVCRESSDVRFAHIELEVNRRAMNGDRAGPGDESRSAMSNPSEPPRQSDEIPAASLSVIYRKSNTSSMSVHGRRRPMPSRGRKAMRTLTLLIVAFCVFWLPNFLNLITYQIDPDLLCRYLEISIATRWCAYCNSLFNPVAYTMAQPLFRQTLRRVACRRERPIQKTW